MPNVHIKKYHVCVYPVWRRHHSGLQPAEQSTAVRRSRPRCRAYRRCSLRPAALCERVLKSAVSALAVVLTLMGCHKEPYVPLPALPPRVEPPSPKLQPLAAQDMHPDSIDSNDSCNIVAIGSSVFGADPITVTEKVTTVRGWFLSAISKKTAVPAHLQLLNQAGIGGWHMPVYATIAQPDIVSFKGYGNAENFGFSQAIDLSPLAAGRYEFVVTFDDGGRHYSCAKRKMISIQ